MKDLGARFCRDRSFIFDKIFIHEIIFDESSDVTLYCTVPYYDEAHGANIGLSFAQLDILLRSNKETGQKVASELADRLNSSKAIPSVVDIEALYGQTLEVSNCMIHTTLFDLTEDDDEEFDDDEEEGAEGEDIEAYAFLVDAIDVMNE